MFEERSAAAPAHGSAAAQSEGRPGWADYVRNYRPLLPTMLGLVCARCGLIATNYGSYSKTDDGIFTDGAMLITIAVMIVLFLLCRMFKKPLSARQETILMNVSIAVESVLVLALAVLDPLFAQQLELHIALSTALTFFASMAIFSWLRLAKDSTCATAALFAFGALVVSELVLYLMVLLPDHAALYTAAALSALQALFVALSRKQPPLRELPQLAGSEGFFGLSASLVEDKRFLTMCAIGIGLLAVVDGLLRGYPDGQPIAFTAATRIGYGLLTIALRTLVVGLVLRGNNHVMSRWIWALLECLACAALMLYALFPQHLEVGAVFTTTLNAMMVGFTWFTIIAYSTHGWRDPLYYCFGGWIVWLGARSAARTALVFLYPLFSNVIVMHALMGSLVILSGVAVFLYCLSIADSQLSSLEEKNRRLEQRLLGTGPKMAAAGAAEDEGELVKCAASAQEARAGRSAFSSILGLDNQNAPQPQPQSAADTRLQAMQGSIGELGRQFLLSPREMEVLTLYALGYTQKRVANELFITESTAHAHIKHIYEKTGMHSRQEIIDYLECYTS